MKRRKLDEIVFGLSAAKEQQSTPSSEPKKHLTSTSSSHNYPTPSNKTQQNLTQQIGAAHRQSSKLDPLAAFLSSQVHEQQSNMLKHTTLQQQLAQQQQVINLNKLHRYFLTSFFFLIFLGAKNVTSIKCIFCFTNTT